jgi:hypothetical protein
MRLDGGVQTDAEVARDGDGDQVQKEQVHGLLLCKESAMADMRGCGSDAIDAAQDQHGKEAALKGEALVAGKIGGQIYKLEGVEEMNACEEVPAKAKSV